MGALRERIEEHIRRHALIEPGGEVCCLVSGGADSTCMWHALGALGYRVSALHVNHGLRGEDSEADARLCAETLGAEVVRLDGAGLTEAELREQRYSLARDRLRATGHTASDQVETILYRLVSRGAPTGIQPRNDDGVVHPLLPVWREETEEYCRAAGIAFRTDSTNRETKRGLIRSELPGLRVRGWRPGDRLAGRSRKIQDVFVDAKVPRSEREAWPLVVRGNDVIAVPGIVEHPDVKASRT